MSTIVMRSSGAGNPAARCAAGVATWLEMQDPADIEDAITAFVPPDQPMRDEYLDQLVKVGRAVLQLLICVPLRTGSLARQTLTPVEYQVCSVVSAQILKLNMGGSEEDADKLMAVISAVTLRIVQRENATGRRSVSHAGRVTVDETLDLIKVRQFCAVHTSGRAMTLGSGVLGCCWFQGLATWTKDPLVGSSHV